MNQDQILILCVKHRGLYGGHTVLGSIVDFDYYEYSPPRKYKGGSPATLAPVP